MIPKNYRPISLLCHTHKLYKRMILKRIAPVVEQRLIKEQAGLRIGKSCNSQLLNLTQHNEDGYQRGNIIVKIWRQSNIIAILKPGKDSTIPKNYRPISLLCHTYKLYERLILNRVSPLLEQHLIKEQAGFRPGKSCTSQLLNLTQHIEDGSLRHSEP